MLEEKQKIIYEKEIDVIDTLTGEIITRTNEVVKTVEKEPPFIKLYLNTMLEFQGIKNISVDILISFCNYITYANNKQMEIYFNKRNKEEIAKNHKMSVSMVNKYITKCIEANIFFKTDCRGVYLVNPFLIAKGEWKNIKLLRTEFDYCNGTWTLKKGISENENQQEKEEHEEYTNQ